MTESRVASNAGVNEVKAYVRRHLRWGWLLLLVFLVLGTILETMHGFKVGWYLNVANDTRRLLLRLSHAHGVLLGLLNIAFAGTVWLLRDSSGSWLRFASPCLLSASLLMPLGFLLGGVITYGDDPGLGIFLLPAGAILLFLGVLSTLRNVSKAPAAPPDPEG